jgi:hypothetical protein
VGCNSVSSRSALRLHPAIYFRSHAAELNFFCFVLRNIENQTSAINRPADIMTLEGH